MHATEKPLKHRQTVLTLRPKLNGTLSKQNTLVDVDSTVARKIVYTYVTCTRIQHHVTNGSARPTAAGRKCACVCACAFARLIRVFAVNSHCPKSGETEQTTVWRFVDYFCGDTRKKPRQTNCAYRRRRKNETITFSVVIYKCARAMLSNKFNHFQSKTINCTGRTVTHACTEQLVGDFTFSVHENVHQVWNESPSHLAFACVQSHTRESNVYVIRVEC